MQLIERFRKWYDYERDCNAKAIAMLQSIPMDRRSDPQFARAVGKMAHLVAARHNWASRLGVIKEPPTDRFPTWPLEDLPAKVAGVEQIWTKHLTSLDEAALDQTISFTFADGKRRRWKLVDLLTQVFGHAWYHRGQIAMLVKDLGGKPVETDYISWDPTLSIE